MAVPYAFATLLTSDRYLPGALALAAALRDLHPSPAQEPEVDFQTVCLVTPETVDVSTIKLLRKTFNVVVGVEVITQEDDKGLQLLGKLPSVFFPRSLGTEGWTRFYHLARCLCHITSPAPTGTLCRTRLRTHDGTRAFIAELHVTSFRPHTTLCPMAF